MSSHLFLGSRGAPTSIGPLGQCTSQISRCELYVYVTFIVSHSILSGCLERKKKTERTVVLPL